jgi:uncharacterized membrane protein
MVIFRRQVPMEEERERLLRFAYLYYKRGEIKKASSFCEPFLAKYPDDPEALELMGDIEAEQAKLQDALFYYKKALQIDPSRKGIEGKIAKIEKELEEVERMTQPSSTLGFPRVFRTSLGIAENVEGFLCYFFPGIFPFIVILLEKESRFARFHAIQSLLLSAVAYVISIPVGIVMRIVPSATPESFEHLFLSLYLPFLPFFVISSILGLLSIWLMFKAYQGEIVKLPWIGDFAERWSAL